MPQPHAFVVLYTGDTIPNCRLVAATADPGIVRAVAGHLLADEKWAGLDPERDPVSAGRLTALKLVGNDPQTFEGEGGA